MNINLKTKYLIKLTLSTLIFALILNSVNVHSQQFASNTKNRNLTKYELQEVATNSWNHYKIKFLRDDERVLDKEDDSTTSEGQSYSMLRAIMMNDKNVFDRTFNWSKKNLQIRKTDNLFAWKTRVDLHGRTFDTLTMNATDADLDIGLALALADHKWSSYGNINYAQELKKLASDIYTHRVVDIMGLKVILPFNSQQWRRIEIINPSYFNPVAYKYMANYDPEHNWNQLAQDSYRFIEWLPFQNGLMPDWVEFNYDTYAFENYPRNLRYGEDNFGYEAFRIYYRSNLDYNVFGSLEAKKLIDNAKWFFEHEYQNHNKISAVYNKYGNPVETYEDMTTTSAAYFIFKNTNSKFNTRLVSDKFYSKINLNKKQFNQDENYYSSTWGWFALADIADIKLIQ